MREMFMTRILFGYALLHRASFADGVSSASCFAVYGNNMRGSSVQQLWKMLLKILPVSRMFFEILNREKTGGSVALSAIPVVFNRLTQ